MYGLTNNSIIFDHRSCFEAKPLTILLVHVQFLFAIVLNDCSAQLSCIAVRVSREYTRETSRKTREEGVNERIDPVHVFGSLALGPGPSAFLAAV